MLVRWTPCYVLKYPLSRILFSIDHTNESFVKHLYPAAEIHPSRGGGFSRYRLSIQKFFSTQDRSVNFSRVFCMVGYPVGVDQ